MKEINRIDVKAPINSLVRVNNTIMGCHQGDIYEVDTLHNTTFVNKISAQPITMKHMHNCFHSGVYICNPTNLHTLSGERLLNFCESSSLTGSFDSSYSLLCFSKHHPKHAKYSLSLLPLSAMPAPCDPKILKLLDTLPCKLTLCDSQLLWTSDHTTYSMDTNTLKVSVVDKGEIMSDSCYLFVVEGLEVRALEKTTKKKAFELETKREPVKVEVWRDQIIVGTPLGIEVYDRRKATRPATILEIPAVTDFLHQPNIERMYIASQNCLFCYSI